MIFHEKHNAFFFAMGFVFHSPVNAIKDVGIVGSGSIIPLTDTNIVV